ncbi:cell division protein ZapA [Tissierella creatinophila]|uniref:Cell division protein ZapA n=1 Tax=Tissierella creatinophila DSM 6911 TaxID=1123403 RepID=A0A1U7M6K5_TISCR|nr:cell division protein ZapA [Tissierella creatinophila]OLS02828.1 cell division protein ZapA [Tissierella creatinophila DSM 6911]
MTERRKIDVKIDGRNFTMVGAGSQEYIEGLASYVDKIIKEVASKNDRLSQIMTATLAALHIADELRQNEKELNELKFKAKDPLDKYDDVCEELKKSKEEIETLNNMCQQYQRQITEYDKKREEIELILEQFKEDLETTKEEISQKDETIKTLQDKNFKNQLEIVDIKKELAEYLRILDEETSS